MKRSSEDLKVWVERKRIENPLANHTALSRCMFAVLYSCYGQNVESNLPCQNAEIAQTVDKTHKGHNKKRRHLRRIHIKQRGRVSKNKSDLSSMKEIEKKVSSTLINLEANVMKHVEKLCGRFDHFEEKWDKEASEQRGFMEYIQRELYALKGTAYLLRNSTLPAQRDSIKVADERVREEMVRGTNGMPSIAEKEIEEDNCSQKQTVESDPLEELLNKKNDNNKMIGFKLRDSKKPDSEEEDPIMALLMQQESENKENVDTVETEVVRPKNLMFQMKKDNGNGNGKKPISMDDLLFNE